MSLRRLLLCALPVMALVGGCLDMTPLLRKEAPQDAGADVVTVDGPWKATCHECTTTDPACGFAACAADSRCFAFDQCITDLGCLATNDLNARIACGQPCFQRVGIKDFTDPSLSLYYPVNGCTTYPVAGSTENGGPCAAVCVLR